MKTFIKISTLTVMAILLITTISCKKEKNNEDIYQTLSGIWESDRDGAPVLYLIGGDEYKIYRYTYPYPIEESEMDAGWFEANPGNNTLILTNSLTEKQVIYTYELSNGNNTLRLDNITYKRSDLN